MSNLIYRITLCLFLVAWAVPSQPAEYSAADNVPDTTSLLFTKNAVALTLEPDYTGGRVGETAHTRYFIAYRTDYEFRQVPREEFAKLMVFEHSQEPTNSREARSYKVTAAEDCSNPGYWTDTGFQDAIGRRTIQLQSVSFNISLRCRSSIADAIQIDDELWIATYEQGDHGEYGAEGVLVVPRNGAPISRIDVGSYPAKDIATDPWSSDVWVVTLSQLALVSEDKQVKTRYWKYHDFDLSRNRPDIFIVASEEEVKNHPLALLARWLGESSYEGLSLAHRHGVTLHGEEPLYNFVMFGSVYSHRPEWPEELVKLLDAAEPNVAWRRFACMLPGERAKELCELELENWPTGED